MEKLSLMEYLKKQGYTELTDINGFLCGIKRFAFTTGLMVGLDSMGYKGRYCYHTYNEALEALLTWDGKGHPEGNWIKYKGEIEVSNPNYE
jgi:hypothetical protein